MGKKRSESRTDRHDAIDAVLDRQAPTAAEQPPIECHAIVESSESAPATCTIYSTASDDSLVTTWISAHEGSYCTLEEMR